MAYLIKGAHVYNPDDLGVQDVLVINDKIAAVGKDLTVVLLHRPAYARNRWRRRRRPSQPYT